MREHIDPDDERYMKQALELARKGLGDTYPNPAVGCVIVCDGRTIGRGYHRRAGEPHAEVNAIDSVEDRTLLPGSTMYVTLEPCAHYGKTPPCAERIVREGISRVVIGTGDPFVRVNGRGVEILRRAGVEVVQGVLQQDCDELNKRFFTYHRKKRPFVVLKWAQTADGFLDVLRTDASLAPLKITGEPAQRYVHRMRSLEQAILVGTRTALLDNPRLDARLAESPRHPLRVAIDRFGRIPLESHLLDGTHSTLLFTEKRTAQCHLEKKNVDCVPIDFSGDTVAQMLDELYRRGIQSVLVEGGAETHASFFRAGCWDEAFVFAAPDLHIGQGVPAAHLPDSAREVCCQRIGENSLTVYKNLCGL